ncbi:MAG: ATP-binding protein [Bauldia sp.]
MITRRLLGALLAGLAVGGLGLILNLNPVRAGFGLELLFGGLGTFFLMRVADPRSALLAAALAAGGAAITLGDAFIPALFLAEAAFCLWLRGRRQIDPLIASPIFWLLVGVPLLGLYYGLVLDYPTAPLIARAANVVVNALANVALGSLLASMVIAAIPRLRSARPRSLRVVIVEVLVALTIMPVLLFSTFAARDYEADLTTAAQQAVSQAALDAVGRAESLLGSVRVRASQIGLLAFRDREAVSDLSANVQLPHGVERIFVANDRRELVVGFAATGITFYPAGAITLPELGYGPILHDQVDETGRGVPVVTVDLFRPETPALGWAVAVVDVDAFRDYVLPAEPVPNVTVGVLSERGAFVVGSGYEDDEGGTTGIMATEPLSLGGWRIVSHYDAEALVAARAERSAQFLALILLVVALGLVASAIIARVVTLPLERLTRAIERSAAGGPPELPGAAGFTEADALVRAVEFSRAEANRYNQENRVLARRLSSLVAHTPMKLYAAEGGTDGFTVTYASPGLGDALGTDLPPGTSYADIDANLHPADRARVAEERRRLLAEGRLAVEYRIVADAGEPRWIAEVAVLVADGGAGHAEIVGVVMDVTARRRADAQMQQSAKLINLGKMAAGLAHELNQPLSVIRMAAENALTALEDQEAETARTFVEKKLSRIEAQVERASRLIDHMKIFGRAPDDRVGPFSPEDAVRAALAMVQAQIRIQAVELRTLYRAGKRTVLGHQQRLEQVVINIVLNALDAIVAKVPEPSLQTAMPRGTIDISVASGDGETVVIEIADNGGGIAPDVLDRVFEPFVTTKPPGAGTGLGLSLSYGIVHDIGGTIVAANRGDGALFRIELPAREAVHGSSAADISAG